MFAVNRTVWVCAMGILIAATMVFSAGCGGPSYEGDERAAVSGKVTFAGNPLPYGTISFTSAGEGRMASGLIENGSYSIPEELGPNLGMYKVEIEGYAAAPVEGDGELDTGEGEEGGEGGDEAPDDRDDDAGLDEDSIVDGETEGEYSDQPIVHKMDIEVDITSNPFTRDFPLTAE